MVISFTSGKGGTGKSSATVGVACAVATKGYKTIVLELDIGLRGLDLFFGIHQPITLDLGNLLSQDCSISQVVIPIVGFDCLHYIPAPAVVPNQFHFSKIERLIQQLRHLYDIILIDTSAGLGLSILSCVRISDHAVIVTTPDPVCIRAGAKVTSLMEEHGFFYYRILINKVSARMLKNSSVSDLDHVLDFVGAQLLGIVPEDHRYRKQSSLGVLPPEHSRIFRIYDAVSQRLQGNNVPLLVTRLFR